MSKLKTSLFVIAACIGLASNAAFAGAHMDTSQDIVDVAAANGSFNTLVAAVQAAGLVDALKGDGPLTVFAPTDEAFAALPDGTVESLLLPENKDQLTAILLYHVVSGKVMASDLQGTINAPTLEGNTLEIVNRWSDISVNNASVVAKDVQASNGVIHVIDAVLLPPAE